MIIVIFCVSVLLLAVGGGVFGKSYDYEWVGAMLGVLGGGGMAVSLVASVYLAISVSNLSVIDQKIEMYEKENGVIEEQISDVVKQYQEYETGIFTSVSPESSVTLVSLYPELKSDALVQKQIEVYYDNNELIKELRAEKINGSVLRWWLYFGGSENK